MMALLDAVRSHLLALSDLVKFAIVLAAFVGIPPLARRIGLSSAVGLLLFGAMLGPHALGFFSENRPIVDFFSEVGKLLLMFSAGLEVDLILFRRIEARAVSFNADGKITGITIMSMAGD